MQHNSEPGLTMEQIIARKLLQLKTFRIQPDHPITWANGWQAPIYFDDRRILSSPAARNFIRLELAHTIARYFPERDVIAGVAVNAIPHAILVAEQLGLPFVYVYPRPKDHALENQIEGDLQPRQSVLVIENQISVGKHAMKVVEALRNNGCKVVGVVTIFNYLLPTAAKRFREADVPVVSLTNFDTMMSEAETLGIIGPEERTILKDWHRCPSKYPTQN